MMKLMKDFASLRLIVLLWLFAIGEALAWADDTSSSNGNSNAVTEDEFVYDFAANNEILAPLATGGTDLSKPQYKDVNITVNAFQFAIHNCLRGTSGYISFRTDLNTTDPAYVRGSMAGTLTQVVIEKRNIRETKISVIQEAQDGTKSTVTETFNSKGTCTIAIPADQQMTDAKSITIQADDARLDATKITIKRKAISTDLKDPWLIFKTLNADASKAVTYPTDNNSAEANEAYIGQIVQLESNDIEGFDPVSAMSNPYVVVYTVGSTVESTPDPEFSNVTDGKKTYWKNGNETYPSCYESQGHQAGDAIDKNGFVYRRGIVLGIEKDADGNLHANKAGDVVTVKVAIFRLSQGENGTVNSEQLKSITKQFTLKDNDTNHQQPKWRANFGNAKAQYDLTFSPSTLKANSGTKYNAKMTLLDPTQSVKVSVDGTWINKGNTILAKFSHNDDYDLQALLNAHSIHINTESEEVTSTNLKMRKLTAMQYTQEGIASETVAQGYYWYIPTLKRLYFELKETGKEDQDVAKVDLNIAVGSETSTKQITLKAYYLDSNNKKQYVDPSTIGLDKQHFNFADDGVAHIEGDITFSATAKTATFTVKGDDNGATSMTISSDKKINANGITDFDKQTEEILSYLPAHASLTIDVSGGNNLMPPSLTPFSQNYSKSFDATIKGYSSTDTKKVKFYYLLTALPISSEASLTTTRQSDSQASSSSSVPPLKDLIEAVEELPTNPSQEYPAYGIIDGSAESADLLTQTVNIPAKENYNYMLCAAAVEVDKDGNVIYDSKNANAPVGSRVIWSDYTYNTLEAPVLSPGTEGENNFYTFSGTLDVEAKMTVDNTLIFYHEGNDEFKFKVNADGTYETNCYRYTSESPIEVKTSTTIRAIAYNPESGIMSDIVTYRYALSNGNMDEPIFHISSSETDITSLASGAKYAQSMTGKQLRIQATYYDADGTDHSLGGDASNVNWDTDTYHIYYTLDGTIPTTNSPKYTGPITDGIDTSKGNIQVHAMVYADGVNGDRSISDVSVLYLLSSNKKYWETTTSNCPDGTLTSTTQVIADESDAPLVNIEFGGTKDSNGNAIPWKHYVSGEYATGEPIDNVGYYTIAPASASADVDLDADVKDEAGNLWNHSKSNDGSDGFQTHKATFGLPASGAYVKFEPKKSGKLTIWCCQEGALYYSNKSTNADRFNEGFLRKRPAYFVDEAGKSLAPSDIQAAGVLSSNWNRDAKQSDWNEKGTEVNGQSQTLYTSDQTRQIYNMFNSVILANSAKWNSPLQPLIVYLNTEANKQVAGFNVSDDPQRAESNKENYIADPIVDGTGICLPSASYMKYTFDVKAGKTYFFFGWMTKIGIRGFGFEPSTEAASQDAPTIFSGKSATSAGGDSGSNDFTECKDKTYAEVTLQREFDADKWTSLVLPFSVSASQVKEVFGDGTEILHYRTIENRTMYFFQHFHQMIVAGTPILIKPAKAYKGTSLPKFTNVTFEKVETGNVADKPCNDYGYKDKDGKEVVNTDCQMIASYKTMDLYNGNYFVGTDGKVHLLKGATGGYTKLSGTNAYIIGKLSDGTQTSLTNMAKAAYNNLTSVDMDSEVTGISFIDADGNVSPIIGIHGKIYNLNGQIVSQDAKGVKSLPKGVYIVNGKKIVIK